MIGTQPVGAIGRVVISAVSHEGLTVTVDGKPARLAIVTDDGQVIASGDQVAREAEAVAVNSYRGFLQGKGFLRVLSKPIERAAEAMSNGDLHCSAGPVSSMPGSLHSVPPGTACDRHPKRLAVRRLQGETDSFGAEYLCLCQHCIDNMKARAAKMQKVEQYCEWHRGMGLDVRPHRDFEEGSAGRLYNVCTACRRQESERLAEELAVDDGGWDD